LPESETELLPIIESEALPAKGALSVPAQPKGGDVAGPAGPPPEAETNKSEPTVAVADAVAVPKEAAVSPVVTQADVPLATTATPGAGFN
jgi:hypothetical protein